MLPRILPAIALLAIAVAPAAAVAKAAVELNSVSLELPFGDRPSRQVLAQTPSPATASPVTLPAWCSISLLYRGRHGLRR